MRGIALAIAATAVLLGAAGCGSSGDAEVTVQTGNLSKTEFTEKADAVCKAARAEFLAKYESFAQAHKSDLFASNKDQQEAALGELIDSVLVDNIEGEVRRISELGAPDAYAAEAEAFLNSLQTQLEEIEDDHSLIGASSFPFKKTEDVARRVGMYGCAESFG
jgi:hypothetical protein